MMTGGDDSNCAVQGFRYQWYDTFQVVSVHNCGFANPLLSL